MLNMLPDYSRADFNKEFSALIMEGLIEVVGMTDEGVWLYGITSKGHTFWETMSVIEDADNIDG